MTEPLPITGLSRLLRLVGLVAVIATSAPAVRWQHPWLAAGVLVSWAGWAGWTVAPAGASRWWPRTALCAMAIGGGLTAARATGSAITALATVFSVLSWVAESVPVCAAIAAVAVLCGGLSAAVAPHPVRALPDLLFALLVAGLMGWSRRQSRTAAVRNRLLLEQNRVIRAERDRAAALAERARIARDIHDVLAHTLGGLVLQLDAADALFEADENDRAAERVRAARGLAADGLDDARRVVGALRSDGFDLTAELQDRCHQHRCAGGQVVVDTEAELRGLDEQVAIALARAVQEALTNARKHAPGRPVTLTLRDQSDQLAVTIANRIAPQRIPLTGSGTGAGLLGMRERIEAVGGTVAAGKENGQWTIRILVPRR
ncbi:sensor histidine kinase [Nocardia sp. NPDC003482]